MTERKASHAVDKFVGWRLKQERENKKISREDLAEALCLPLRVLERIETGEASIGAISLYEASQIIGVPVTVFFEGYEQMSRQVESAKVVKFRSRLTSESDTIK